MRFTGVIILAGACVLLSLSMGMSGCQPIINNSYSSGDLLDLSSSRDILFWYGNSTFTITSHTGQILLIDPFNPQTAGLPSYTIAPDLVLMTSNDADVSDTTHWWKNSPTIVRGVDEAGSVASIDRDYGAFHVTAVPSLHGCRLARHPQPTRSS